MNRTLSIGDVIELNNQQKFRIIYSNKNGKDVYIFVGIRDWNVYFETDNLEYGIGDEIHKDSGIVIKKILSKDETPTLIAIVG